MKKAREEGNIARSQDLNNLFSLVALAVFLYVFGTKMGGEVPKAVSTLLDQINGSTDPKQYLQLMGSLLFRIVLPILLLVTGLHLVNYVLQVRFLFVPKLIMPKPSRLNPKGYFSRLFGRKGLIQVGKSLLYTVLIGYVGYVVVKKGIAHFVGAIGQSWSATLLQTLSELKSVFLVLLLLTAVLAIGDYIYQKWEHGEDLKMKKEEVKQEHKDNEGNPEVKHQQKSFMHAIIQGAVAKKMEDATFIVNNPTHISVALRYRKNVDAAPVLLAKGEDELAMYMRQLAKENKIPMVANKPLARSVYYNVNEGEMIPEDLYVAAIEVMRYLIQTKQLEL
nr:flagellar type III secretion system protein FlhB [Ectobacillus ponti]